MLNQDQIRALSLGFLDRGEREPNRISLIFSEYLESGRARFTGAGAERRLMIADADVRTEVATRLAAALEGAERERHRGCELFHVNPLDINAPAMLKAVRPSSAYTALLAQCDAVYDPVTHQVVALTPEAMRETMGRLAELDRQTTVRDIGLGVVKGEIAQNGGVVIVESVPRIDGAGYDEVAVALHPTPEAALETLLELHEAHQLEPTRRESMLNWMLLDENAAIRERFFPGVGDNELFDSIPLDRFDFERLKKQIVDYREALLAATQVRQMINGVTPSRDFERMVNVSQDRRQFRDTDQSRRASADVIEADRERLIQKHFGRLDNPPREVDLLRRFRYVTPAELKRENEIVAGITEAFNDTSRPRAKIFAALTTEEKLAALTLVTEDERTELLKGIRLIKDRDALRDALTSARNPLGHRLVKPQTIDQKAADRFVALEHEFPFDSEARVEHFVDLSKADQALAFQILSPLERERAIEELARREIEKRETGLSRDGEHTDSEQAFFTIAETFGNDENQLAADVIEASLDPQIASEETVARDEQELIAEKARIAERLGQTTASASKRFTAEMIDISPHHIVLQTLDEREFAIVPLGAVNKFVVGPKMLASGKQIPDEKLEAQLKEWRFNSIPVTFTAEVERVDGKETVVGLRAYGQYLKTIEGQQKRAREKEAARRYHEHLTEKYKIVDPLVALEREMAADERDVVRRGIHNATAASGLVVAPYAGTNDKLAATSKSLDAASGLMVETPLTYVGVVVDNLGLYHTGVLHESGGVYPHKTTALVMPDGRLPAIGARVAITYEPHQDMLQAQVEHRGVHAEIASFMAKHVQHVEREQLDAIYARLLPVAFDRLAQQSLGHEKLLDVAQGAQLVENMEPFIVNGPILASSQALSIALDSKTATIIPIVHAQTGIVLEAGEEVKVALGAEAAVVLEHGVGAERAEDAVQAARVRDIQNVRRAAERHLEVADLARYLNMPAENLRPIHEQGTIGTPIPVATAFESNNNLYLTTERQMVDGTEVVFYHPVPKFGSEGGYSTDAHELKIAGGGALTVSSNQRIIIETATDRAHEPILTSLWKDQAWVGPTFESSQTGTPGPRWNSRVWVNLQIDGTELRVIDHVTTAREAVDRQWPAFDMPTIADRTGRAPTQLPAIGYTKHTNISVPNVTVDVDGQEYAQFPDVALAAIKAAEAEHAVVFDVIDLRDENSLTAQELKERPQRRLLTLTSDQLDLTPLRDIPVGAPLRIESRDGVISVDRFETASLDDEHELSAQEREELLAQATAYDLEFFTKERAPTIDHDRGDDDDLQGGVSLGR